MEVLGGLLILVVAVGAFFGAPRFAVALRWTLAAALLVFAVGVYLLFWAPSDYLVRFPTFSTVLHPYLVAFYVALSLVLGTGISLGLLGATLQAGRREKGAPSDEGT